MLSRSPVTRVAIISFGLSLISSSALAEVTWLGDFETGDTSQWSNVLNPSGITVEEVGGNYAGQITITDAPEHIWSNGLNRVELQYAPPDVDTAEGSTSVFGWSFSIPWQLTEDGHQIGYYESKSSYQQVMSFPVQGSTISFVTRKPTNQEHWKGEGLLQEKYWHDIVIQVMWSKQTTDGFVNVWFDGDQVVEQAPAQTLADDNPHFVQLGILRDTIATNETILIDNARAGTLEDVLAMVPNNDAVAPGTGGGGGPMATGGVGTELTGGAPGAGGLSATGGLSAAGGASQGGPSGGTGTVGENPSADSSGGCAISPSGPARLGFEGAGLLMIAGMIVGRRRRVFGA